MCIVQEYGAISFEFDSGGPSRIEAWVPQVTSSGVATVWQPDSETVGMEAAIERNDLSRMIYLQNKTPKWDEAHGGHVLNFQGRVTESSVKNFQLCCLDAEDPEEIILQFGRVGKHKFSMDLRFPLSPLQAFSICVACLDGKIADRKGYEYIKKMAGGGGNNANATGLSSTESGSQKSGGIGILGGGNVQSVEKGGGGGSIQKAEGSMSGGNGTITDMFRDVLPSGQYLKDKINRKFK